MFRTTLNEDKPYKYKISNVRKKEMKNGAPMTIFSISDTEKKADGSKEYLNCDVLVFKDYPELKEGDFIYFTQCNGFKPDGYVRTQGANAGKVVKLFNLYLNPEHLHIQGGEAKENLSEPTVVEDLQPLGDMDMDSLPF